MHQRSVRTWVLAMLSAPSTGCRSCCLQYSNIAGPIWARYTALRSSFVVQSRYCFLKGNIASRSARDSLHWPRGTRPVVSTGKVVMEDRCQGGVRFTVFIYHKVSRLIVNTWMSHFTIMASFQTPVGHMSIRSTHRRISIIDPVSIPS